MHNKLPLSPLCPFVEGGQSLCPFMEGGHLDPLGTLGAELDSDGFGGTIRLAVARDWLQRIAGGGVGARSITPSSSSDSELDDIALCRTRLQNRHKC